MGSLFAPKAAATPPPPPPLPPAAISPTMANTAVAQAGASQRGRAAAAAGSGFDNTLSPSGAQGDLVPAPSAKAALLG
jgi:hypothetical protein